MDLTHTTFSLPSPLEDIGLYTVNLDYKIKYLNLKSLICDQYCPWFTHGQTIVQIILDLN